MLSLAVAVACIIASMSCKLPSSSAGTFFWATRPLPCSPIWDREYKSVGFDWYRCTTQWVALAECDYAIEATQHRVRNCNPFCTIVYWHWVTIDRWRFHLEDWVRFDEETTVAFLSGGETEQSA